MQELLSERLRAEFAAMEPVYIDGVAGVLNLGANYATYYYRWGHCQREGGNLWRVPALVVIRPRSSLVCPATCIFSKTLDSQSWPKQVVAQMQ